MGEGDAKVLFSSVEALSQSKFWKECEHGHIAWTVRNSLMKCLQTRWYWQDLAQAIVKYHLPLVEALPRSKLWKKWNWPYILNLVEYFYKILQICIDIDKI